MAPSPRPRPPPRPPPSAEARLLVVDDEPNILELLSVSLRFSGFEVHTASNGQQALTRARSLKPDLLVLDVMMPELDGFEVVRRLRGEGSRAPVLFLTAKDGTEDKVRGLTLGGDDYVTKPFSLEEVVARIRAVLRRGDAVQQAARHPPGLRRPRARRGLPRGLEGRRAGRAVADGVQPAALLHAEPRAGC